MAKKFSTALQRYIATQGSVNDALNNGVIILFDGTQPTTADASYSSSSATALVAITENSGAVTMQIDPYFSIECTSTGTDTLTSLTFAGIELLNGSVANGGATATFATNLISAINNNYGALNVYAKLKAGSTTIVQLYLPKGTGASLNSNDSTILTRAGATLALKVNNTALTWPDSGNTKETVSGITAISGYCVAGVDGANLLSMITSTAGTTSKEVAAWSGVAGTDTGKMATALAAFNTYFSTSGFSGFTSGTKTATWFRYYASMLDPELGGTATTDTNTEFLRYDGSIGTTSAYDMVASGGTTVTYGATHTIPTFTFTVPETQS